MSRPRDDRTAKRAEKHAAKAREKRATAEAYLSAVPAGEPTTPQARGFEACPCPKDCTLHGECLLCVSFHGHRGEQPRCLR
jgi:hypothetical protein